MGRMRRPRSRPLVVVAVAALAVAANATGMSGLTVPGVERGVVASVHDGDTLTLRDGRKIRLVQIDTPELGGGECYSRKARAHLVALAPVGASVLLIPDRLLDATDRYGRALRYVVREETSINVNVELVRQGAAAPYFYRREHGMVAAELYAAAREAQQERRGLWAACPSTTLDPYHQIDTGTSGPPSKKAPSGGTCDRSYPGVCLPPPPPDLDCRDLGRYGVTGRVNVVGADPHRLDGNHDGVAC